MLKQVSYYFGDVLTFLEENVNLCPATLQNPLDIFENPQDHQDVRLELAAILDASIHFVKSTYNLEGDGLLIFSCYEHLSAASQAVGVGHYPCTLAVAREIGDQKLVILHAKLGWLIKLNMYPARTKLFSRGVQRPIPQ